MKRLLPCLLVLAGCAKVNYQYSIVSNFYTPAEGQNWLVVSNDSGNILKIFEVPASGKQLTEQFDYESSDAPATYNLHLVHQGDSISFSYIQSFYSVKNGAAVDFNPGGSGPFYSYIKHKVIISGIYGVKSVVVPGTYHDFNSGGNGYNSNTHTASLDVYPLSEADVVIHIRPDHSGPYQSYYLPTAGTKSDTTFLQWSDFVSENHFLTIEPSGNGLVEEIEVSAVDPDFKRFVTLASSWLPAFPSTSSMNRVALPQALNPQSLFRVRVRQGGFITEKIYPPGEILHLEGPQVDVLTAISTPFHTLQIATGGNPDLVAAYGRTDEQHWTAFQQWSILGPPEAFKQMRLPDLTELIPGLRKMGTDSISWQVMAIQYDQLDYNQILAGFPYKGGDGRFFPIARSGLQMVTKDY